MCGGGRRKWKDVYIPDTTAHCLGQWYRCIPRDRTASLSRCDKGDKTSSCFDVLISENRDRDRDLSIIASKMRTALISIRDAHTRVQSGGGDIEFELERKYEPVIRWL